MVDLRVDRELLERFESGLDLRRPERCAIPARILAHGKGSTILAVEHPAIQGFVLKRLALFRSEDEAGRYEATLRRYVRSLGQRAGIRVVPSVTARVGDPARGRWTVYIIQERMPEAAIGHRVIGDMSPDGMNNLAIAMLTETAKVFDFNQAHKGELELGFDGRISNWAVGGEVANFAQAYTHAVGKHAYMPSSRLKLSYLDISTPLMRQRGVEQLDPTPLLRVFPAIASPIVRRALLPDVMVRYYDFRRVSLDLLSSILNAGYRDFIGMLADSVNWFFLAERREMHFRPITVQEIVAYHRRDAWRWQAYLRLRR